MEDIAVVRGMATRSGEWDWEKLFGLIPQFLLNKIAGIMSPSDGTSIDRLAWN